jgi:uncharacterized protein
MTGNPCVWFEIYVRDLDRAKRFYESVFQVTLQKLDSPLPELELWAFPSDMNRYGTGGALVRKAGAEPGGNSTLVYFHCEDCGVEEARAAASGGRVQMPKTSLGQYGQMSLVVDTEGNLIGLHSM